MALGTFTHALRAASRSACAPGVPGFGPCSRPAADPESSACAACCCPHDLTLPRFWTRVRSSTFATRGSAEMTGASHHVSARSPAHSRSGKRDGLCMCCKGGACPRANSQLSPGPQTAGEPFLDHRRCPVPLSPQLARPLRFQVVPAARLHPLTVARATLRTRTSCMRSAPEAGQLVKQ